MARPSKLTQKTQDLICEAIESGATYNDASAIAGVSYATFNLWMKTGRETDRKNKFSKFLEAVELSNAKCRVSMAAVIRDEAKKGDWRAAESFLKRRDPENWGDKQKTEHSGAVEDAEVAPVLSSIPAELIAPDFLGMYRDIISGNSTEYLAKGGRGSTKSSFVSLMIVYLIVNNPSYNALLSRNITNTLRDSVFAQVKWAIGMLGLWDYFKASVAPMGIEYLPTGQMIYFRGADKPEKLKGIIPKVGYIALLWLEELDQFRGQPALRNIKQTAIRGGEEAYTFLTYNPPKSTGNWVNKYSLIPKEGQYVHSSDYRNVPPEWLGQPFIDEAEHLKDVNPQAYRHEYLGEVTGTGGMVFDNVTTRKITDEELAQFDRPLHGLDWGYFPDPFSYGKMHYDAARMKLYIYGEYRSNRQSNLETYEKIKENGYNDSDLIIADSAEPKSVADYRSYGANIRGAEKGAGSVKYSMKWLQSRAEIIIDPARAPHHAIEFAGYEFEQDKNGEFITAYPDKNNHAIDNVRYATNLIWRRRGA